MELPNATNLCTDIPVTDVCSGSLSLLLPSSQELHSSVACTIHNSSFGRMSLESCVRREEIESNPQLFENGSVCFTDVNSSANDTLVHFFCLSDPCLREGEECNVEALLTSYRIIIADGMLGNGTDEIRYLMYISIVSATYIR